MENVYLFLGEEELIIQNKINKIITQSKADAFNINVYDMEEDTISKAINDCMTPPFLSDSKVVVIKRPVFLEKSKTIVEHNHQSLLNYINNPAPFTILIINGYGININEKLSITKEVMKNVTVDNSRKISKVEAAGWLKRQFNNIGYAIDMSTCTLFLDRIGDNLVNAKNEFNKMITYLGKKMLITDDDVIKVVTREIERDVFSLTNAILVKDKEKTISIYEDLVLAGNDPMNLFSLVSKTINLLLLTKQCLEKNMNMNEIASTLSVSSGRASHLVSDSKAFSVKELEYNVLKFHDLDYKIKSGQIDPSTGVEVLIFGVNR